MNGNKRPLPTVGSRLRRGALAPFVLGLKGPAQVLEIATKSGARCHLIPRAGSGLTKPVVVDIPPFFCIHVGDAWEDGDGRVHVVTSAWDLRDPTHFPRDKDAVPFLGAWSGPAPDFKRIPPSLLFETVVDPATGTLVSHENPQPVRGLCIEHPHVDGSGKVWASLANDRGVSSPPSGYVCYDLETGGVERWYAGPRKFCEELVVAPKGGDDEGAWLLGMIYDAATDASSVNVFDGDRIAAGPVAVAPLPRFPGYVDVRARRGGLRASCFVAAAASSSWVRPSSAVAASQSHSQ